MVDIKKVGMTPAERATFDNAAAGAVVNGQGVDDLMNALVEIGELIAEQEDALVELAGMIEEEGE